MFQMETSTFLIITNLLLHFIFTILQLESFKKFDFSYLNMNANVL